MTVIEVKPPQLTVYQPMVIDLFLAGSIENGKAEDWQSDITRYIKTFFSEYNINILNPRRTAWDSSWKQTIENKNFKDQVNWEMDHLDSSDIIFFNFLGDTMSPISLLELGYVCKTKKEIIICCEKDFWRRGNIEVVADRNNIQLFDDFTEAKTYLKSILKDKFKNMFPNY